MEEFLGDCNLNQLVDVPTWSWTISRRFKESTLDHVHVVNPCEVTSLQWSTSNQKLHKNWHISTIYHAQSAGLSFNIPSMYNLVLWNNFLIKKHVKCIYYEIKKYICYYHSFNIILLQGSVSVGHIHSFFVIQSETKRFQVCICSCYLSSSYLRSDMQNGTTESRIL